MFGELNRRFQAWLTRLAKVRAPGSETISSPLTPLHPKLAANMAILGTEYGQLNTFGSHRPVDGSEKPIPWFTYGAIEYLKRLDCRDWRVFEFGTGNSTIYWIGRGAHVISVEHNRDWFDEMQKRNLTNSVIIYGAEKSAYVGAIAQRGIQFDVIVVDGVWREACVDISIDHLKEDGFLILDNSDWYHEAAARIREKGFHEVSFSGFGPVNDYTWTTSLFFHGTLACQKNMLPPNPIGGNRISLDARDEWW